MHLIFVIFVTLNSDTLTQSFASPFKAATSQNAEITNFKTETEPDNLPFQTTTKSENRSRLQNQTFSGTPEYSPIKLREMFQGSGTGTQEITTQSIAIPMNEFHETSSIGYTGSRETGSYGPTGSQDTASNGFTGSRETGSYGPTGSQDTASNGYTGSRETGSYGPTGSQDTASIGYTGSRETESIGYTGSRETESNLYTGSWTWFNGISDWTTAKAKGTSSAPHSSLKSEGFEQKLRHLSLASPPVPQSYQSSAYHHTLYRNRSIPWAFPSYSPGWNLLKFGAWIPRISESNAYEEAPPFFTTVEFFTTLTSAAMSEPSSESTSTTSASTTISEPIVVSTTSPFIAKKMTYNGMDHSRLRRPQKLDLEYDLTPKQEPQWVTDLKPIFDNISAHSLTSNMVSPEPISTRSNAKTRNEIETNPNTKLPRESRKIENVSYTRSETRSNIGMTMVKVDSSTSDVGEKARNKSVAFRKQLGEKEDMILIGGNMVLVISAVVSNLIVLKYYRHQIKKLIPFVYFSVALADLVTALSCLLHPVTLFLLLYFPSLKISSSILIFVSFLVSSSSIRVGVFNNLVLSVVRSINIVQPFYQIKLRYLKCVTAIYPAIWVVLGSLDIYWIVDLGYMSYPKAMFKHLIYRPMSGSGLAALFLGEDATYLQIIMFGMTVPFLIPCLIVCVCLVFQIHYLNISTAHLKQGSKIASKRPAITIFQLTVLFIICNLTATVVFISYYAPSGSQTRRTGARDARIMYLSSCVLHVFNATFSPLIMILRGRSLKATITSELRTFRSRFSSRSSSVEPCSKSNGVKVALYRY